MRPWKVGRPLSKSLGVAVSLKSAKSPIRIVFPVGHETYDERIKAAQGEPPGKSIGLTLRPHDASEIKSLEVYLEETPGGTGFRHYYSADGKALCRA